MLYTLLISEHSFHFNFLAGRDIILFYANNAIVFRFL